MDDKFIEWVSTATGERLSTDVQLVVTNENFTPQRFNEEGFD